MPMTNPLDAFELNAVGLSDETGKSKSAVRVRYTNRDAKLPRVDKKYDRADGTLVWAR